MLKKNQKKFSLNTSDSVSSWIYRLIIIIGLISFNARAEKLEVDKTIEPQPSETDHNLIPSKPLHQNHTNRLKLVEYFTANTLDPSEIKLGFNLETSLREYTMISTDLFATLLGTPTIYVKWQVWRNKKHMFAIGARASYTNKNLLLWGSMGDYFEQLDANMIQPSIVWSNKVSPRLNIHSFWAVGQGATSAVLSEKGKKEMWEHKHPGFAYEGRNREDSSTSDDDSEDDDNSDKNQEGSIAGESMYAQRSLQLQSMLGLVSNTFQITGEYQRDNSKKILITSRIDSARLEKLTSEGARLTASQQWVWNHFQFRMGIGIQYQLVSGQDLDGEVIQTTQMFPVPDMDFYWRF